MYSKMLYVRTRVTFRVDYRLAAALRQLPNQTRFVEKALKDALGNTCPVCRGSGRVAADSLRVSDFRRAALPKLERAAAAPLKELVRFARRMQATDLALEARPGDDDLEFRLARDEEVLLIGRLNPTGGALRLN